MSNKYGEVVHIRLMPQDVMSCIDICKAAGILTTGMSLAQVVKLATSGLIDAARKSGKIPTRDGFEYSQMVQPFLETGRNAKKLQISSMMEEIEVNRIVSEEDSPEVKRKKSKLLMRIMELNQKKEVDPDNFSEADELQQLNAEFEKLL